MSIAEGKGFFWRDGRWRHEIRPAAHLFHWTTQDMVARDKETGQLLPPIDYGVIPPGIYVAVARLVMGEISPPEES